MLSNLEMSLFVENFASSCSRVQIKNFAKDEVITTYIEKRNQVCILVDGEADFIRYDSNGNKTIICHFMKNDTFGEVFYPANTNNELFVEAKSSCRVLFFNYSHLLNKCKRSCSFHKELEDKFSELLLTQIISLNTRIEHLTKRTIRDKLLSYFNLKASKTLTKTVVVPFSYTDLADYLSVDRSAMMREIKNLIDEGFIERDKNRIKLLY